MFLHYNKKHKKQYLISKTLIFLGILLALLLGAHFGRVKLPTFEDSLRWGSGIIGVIIIGALAYLNRLKALFKIKSIGFIILWGILYLLSVSISGLLWTTGLVSIVLLIDDIFVVNYFKYVNVKYYWKEIMAYERANQTLV